jgi:methionyl-tRNA formyltransferase
VRLVFIGTADFALPGLQALCKEKGMELALVITQPDRPSGRGMEVSPTPVKKLCQSEGFPFIQPESINSADIVGRLKELQPEIIVVVAYGQKLSAEVLNIPRLGCVNLHASLLPALRGAAPIHWALLNGLVETGVTTIKMSEGMDAGDILLQKTTSVSDDDDFAVLHDRLADMGADLLLETVRGLQDGKITPQPQDSSLVTLAPRLKPEDREIDWKSPARAVFNRIRAFSPSPGARSMLAGREIKLYRASIPAGEDNRAQPGTITSINSTGAVIACGNGAVLVRTIQLPGKKPQPPQALLAGRCISVGSILGENT